MAKTKEQLPKKPKINGKSKGNAYEREVVKIFKDLGYTECGTSRYLNRSMDDKKVDCVGLEPLYIQCKATEKAPNFHEVLASMPQTENYNLVFHKRNRKGTVVAMSLDDFMEIWGMLTREGIIKVK